MTLVFVLTNPQDEWVDHITLTPVVVLITCAYQIPQTTLLTKTASKEGRPSMALSTKPILKVLVEIFSITMLLVSCVMYRHVAPSWCTQLGSTVRPDGPWSIGVTSWVGTIVISILPHSSVWTKTQNTFLVVVTTLMESCCTPWKASVVHCRVRLMLTVESWHVQFAAVSLKYCEVHFYRWFAVF